MVKMFLQEGKVYGVVKDVDGGVVRKEDDPEKCRVCECRWEQC